MIPTLPAALGAGPLRLVRQLLFESVRLALAGGALRRRAAAIQSHHAVRPRGGEAEAARMRALVALATDKKVIAR